MTLRGASRQLRLATALRASCPLSQPQFAKASQTTGSRCFTAWSRHHAPHNDNTIPPQVPRQPARQSVPLPTQNQAETAILNKLSTLTPEQITELLSSPAGTTSPAAAARAAAGYPKPGSSLPGASSTSHQTPAAPSSISSSSSSSHTVTTSSRTIFARYPNLRKWSLRVLFALVAFYAGSEFAEYTLELSPFYYGVRTLDDPLLDLAPAAQGAVRLELAINAASEYATTYHLFPNLDQFDAGETITLSSQNPTLDLIYEFARLASDTPKNKALGESILSASMQGRPHLGSRLARDEVEPGDWPAHVALMALDPLTQARKRRHLVAGAYDTADTMGLVHHVFRDRKTGDMSMILMFGQAMCGWPGLVHGGAMATVMDEAMGRVAAREFSAQTAVTARLEMQYLSGLKPLELVVVKMRPMTEEAARRKQRDFLVHDLLRRVEKGSEREKRFKKMLADLDASPQGQESIRGGDDADFAKESDVEGQGKEVAAVEKKKKPVQTDRRMWLVARMERASDGEPICEAEGLFVVPKGGRFKPLPKEW